MDFPCTQLLTEDLNESNYSESDEKRQVGVLVIEENFKLGIEKTEFPIFEGDNIIGRHDNCNISIPLGVTMSKKHACIEADKSSCFIYDCNSSNKTKLESLKLKPDVRYCLQHGNSIEFANIKSVFKQILSCSQQSNNLAIPEDKPPTLELSSASLEGPILPCSQPHNLATPEYKPTASEIFSTKGGEPIETETKLSEKTSLQIFFKENDVTDKNASLKDDDSDTDLEDTIPFSSHTDTSQNDFDAENLIIAETPRNSLIAQDTKPLLTPFQDEEDGKKAIDDCSDDEEYSLLTAVRSEPLLREKSNGETKKFEDAPVAATDDTVHSSLVSPLKSKAGKPSIYDMVLPDSYISDADSDEDIFHSSPSSDVENEPYACAETQPFAGPAVPAAVVSLPKLDSVSETATSVSTPVKSLSNILTSETTENEDQIPSPLEAPCSVTPLDPQNCADSNFAIPARPKRKSQGQNKKLQDDMCEYSMAKPKRLRSAEKKIENHSSEIQHQSNDKKLINDSSDDEEYSRLTAVRSELLLLEKKNSETKKFDEAPVAATDDTVHSSLVSPLKSKAGKPSIYDMVLPDSYISDADSDEDIFHSSPSSDVENEPYACAETQPFAGPAVPAAVVSLPKLDSVSETATSVSTPVKSLSNILTSENEDQIPSPLEAPSSVLSVLSNENTVTSESKRDPKKSPESIKPLDPQNYADSNFAVPARPKRKSRGQNKKLQDDMFEYSMAKPKRLRSAGKKIENHSGPAVPAAVVSLPKLDSVSETATSVSTPLQSLSNILTSETTENEDQIPSPLEAPSSVLSILSNENTVTSDSKKDQKKSPESIKPLDPQNCADSNFAVPARPKRKGRGQNKKLQDGLFEYSLPKRLRSVSEKLETNNPENSSKVQHQSTLPRRSKRRDQGTKTKKMLDEVATPKRLRSADSLTEKSRAKTTKNRFSGLQKTEKTNATIEEASKPVSNDSTRSSTRRITRSRASVANLPPKDTQVHDSSFSLRARKEKPKVMFTGFIDKLGESIVKDLGGQVTDDVHQCTHLVTDQMRRTVKFLCAVVRGIPVLNHQWLRQSKDCQRFLPEDNFPLTESKQNSSSSPPGNIETQFGFKLSESLKIARSRSQPLFEGYRIHVTKSVLPPPEQMYQIIECGGGKREKKFPKGKDLKDVVIVSSETDKRICASAVKAGIAIHSKEFILSGILQQKLSFKKYKLL